MHGQLKVKKIAIYEIFFFYLVIWKYSLFVAVLAKQRRRH